MPEAGNSNLGKRFTMVGLIIISTGLILLTSPYWLDTFVLKDPQALFQIGSLNVRLSHMLALVGLTDVVVGLVFYFRGIRRT